MLKPKNLSSLTNSASRSSATAKADRNVVVTTNGCFDVLHLGHLRYLQAARQLGDLLVVAVNSDSSVRELKGENRPLVPEDERA